MVFLMFRFFLNERHCNIIKDILRCLHVSIFWLCCYSCTDQTVWNKADV
jgi:hypothetical protein